MFNDTYDKQMKNFCQDIDGKSREECDLLTYVYIRDNKPDHYKKMSISFKAIKDLPTKCP